MIPGGGNAALIIGAMGAALVSMACNLTIGRAKYRDVEDEMNSEGSSLAGVFQRVEIGHMVIPFTTDR